MAAESGGGRATPLRPEGHHAHRLGDRGEGLRRGPVPWLPAPPAVRCWRCANRRAAGVRTDSGLSEGVPVGSLYDPMLSKVIAYGPDRATAIRKLRAALADTVILGVPTNAGFLRRLLAHPDVVAGTLDTGLVEREAEGLVPDGVPDEVYAAAAAVRLDALAPRPDAGAGRTRSRCRAGGVRGVCGSRWRSRCGCRDMSPLLRAPGLRDGRARQGDDRTRRYGRPLPPLGRLARPGRRHLARPGPRPGGGVPERGGPEQGRTRWRRRCPARSRW